MLRRRFAIVVSALSLTACGSAPAPEAPKPLPAPSATAEQPPPALTTPDAPFRQQAPAPGPDVVFKAPAIQESKLSNGIRVLFVERHELPLVSVRLVAHTGADQGSPGVGAFTGAMLLTGTKTRSAEQISDEFQALGAQQSSFVGYDASELQAQVVTSKFEPALALLADVAQHPSFPKDELTQERAKRLTALQQERDVPQRFLYTLIGEVLYPAKHPYSASLLGNEAALKKLSAADLQSFYKGTFQPDNLTIAVAGDTTQADLTALLEKSFGQWKGKAAKPRAIPEPPALAADAARVVIVDRPGSSQTNVAVTMVGVPRTSKDYDALQLMNTILGGQFSSRLNLNLREKHGYTYGAGSGFAMRHGPGPFTASGAIVREHTAAAIKEIFTEIEAMTAAPVTEEELADAKSNLIKRLPALFETVGETTSTLATLATFGLPLDEYATRPARIEKLTREDVQRVAQTYLKPAQMRVVMVGDAGQIRASLDALKLGKIEVRSMTEGDAAGQGAATKKP